MCVRLASYAGVRGVSAVDDVLRVLIPALALFGAVGLGPTRLLLPDGLRRHEWLWVLPVGAVATAFAMTPLGFAFVPFLANLAVVAVAGLAWSIWAVRRRGWPAWTGGGAIAWPAYLAALLFCVALIPLFRAGFATVVGQGSDAHLATGTAEFLRHAHPLGFDASLPVDEMPLVWRSKQAIYYALGAVATLGGVETYEAISTLAALLLALAATGLYVLAREGLGAGVGAAAAAMAIAGLDRMVLHTGMHPYFNQTWGYLTLPWALVLAWWAVRHPSRGGLALLALFLAIAAFSYPLALPIPVLAGAAMWWSARRGRRTASLRAAVRAVRARGAGVQLAAAGLGLLLIVPAFGVYEKLSGGLRLITSPNYSLALWGGDLQDYFPEREFFAIGLQRGWWVALAVIAAFAAWELRRAPRPLAVGLGAVIAVSALIAAEMRLRAYGYYFHFKLLAFVGPLVIVLAAVGLARVRRRRLGLVALAVWLVWAGGAARDETSSTFDELPRTALALRDWERGLPPGASVRLDMAPGAQLWAAYLLAARPTCSQAPLLNTAYPHVPVSRAADYVLVRFRARPRDATGAPVRANREYQLYRLRPGLPGGDRCSQRAVGTVTRIERG